MPIYARCLRVIIVRLVAKQVKVMSVVVVQPLDLLGGDVLEVVEAQERPVLVLWRRLLAAAFPDLFRLVFVALEPMRGR